MLDRMATLVQTRMNLGHQARSNEMMNKLTHLRQHQKHVALDQGPEDKETKV